MRRAFVLLLGSALAISIVVACVGDDPGVTSGVAPDPNVPAGHFRGACAEGKCLEGLACTQGVCLYPDYPDGGAPVGDASAEASVDAQSDDGASSCKQLLVPANQVACPGASPPSCAAGQQCCTEGSVVSCKSTSSPCPRQVECTGAGTCSSQCCLEISSDKLAALKASPVCPAPIPLSEFHKTECNTACDSKQPRVCQVDSECTTGTCHPVALKGLGGDIHFGICY